MSYLATCMFTSGVSGLSDFTDGTAVTGWMNLANAGAVNGATYSYRAMTADRTGWEEGRGVYSSGGGTLARTTIYRSSNANAKVNFATAPIVFITLLKVDMDDLQLISDGTAVSVLGRSANSAGNRADIAASADGQVLRRSGGAVGFGAVDLADADAVTGVLPTGNLPASSTSAAGTVEKATAAEVYSAATDKGLTADLIESASAEVTLTDGASPAFDWDAGINRVWTMAANRACPNPTNGQPGTYRTIRVIGNDATNRTLTFGTQYEGDLPTLTDIDNAKQYLLYVRCITSTHFVVSAQNASVV